MKINKSTLKKIIKEEISKTLQEQSLQQKIGLPPGAFSMASLIDALEKMLAAPELPKDIATDLKSGVSELENMVSNQIRKKGTQEEKDKLKKLRDNLLQKVGRVDKDGRTSYERSREKRVGSKEIARQKDVRASVAQDLARMRDRRGG
tara:strand:+ start:5423 stop:5866 length:444 start_codon:yes stop_codon:yes gene_type:complete